MKRNVKIYSLISLVTGLIFGTTLLSGTIEPRIFIAEEKIVCDVSRNLSNSELSSAVSTYCDKTTASELTTEKHSNFLKELQSSTSNFISNLSYTKVYAQKDYGAIRLGTSSAIGEITITFSKKIKKLGLYVSAWDNSKESKNMLVNNQEIGLTRGNYVSDPMNDDLRVIVEFATTTDTVTISSKVKTNNRILIYSMGFYTTTNQ